MTKSPEEILAMIPAAAFRGNVDTTYAPKLSFEQRCEVLAFYHKGISIRFLAAAFGLHRRTVSHLVSSESKHYKKVRDEHLALGIDDFFRKYATVPGSEKIAAALRSPPPEVEQNSTEYAEAKSVGTHPNRRKNTHEGSHLSDTGHSFEIAWKSEGDEDVTGKFDKSGWYYAAGSESSIWLADPATNLPFNSSKLAHDTAKIEVNY